jgi:endoribonuclease Nob1
LQNSASNKLVIDASAFYSGFPFLTLSTCYTTNSILNEIKHMNRKYGAIELLIDSDRLKILEADKECLRQVVTMAKKTGDYEKLSTADVSILALAFQLKSTLISDDYAVQNMAATLKIPVGTIGTKGITKVRRWINFCNACGKAYGPNISQCMLCGNTLRRRFKNNSV